MKTLQNTLSISLLAIAMFPILSLTRTEKLYNRFLSNDISTINRKLNTNITYPNTKSADWFTNITSISQKRETAANIENGTPIVDEKIANEINPRSQVTVSFFPIVTNLLNQNQKVLLPTTAVSFSLNIRNGYIGLTSYSFLGLITASQLSFGVWDPKTLSVLSFGAIRIVNDTFGVISYYKSVPLSTDAGALSDNIFFTGGLSLIIPVRGDRFYDKDDDDEDEKPAATNVYLAGVIGLTFNVTL